MISSPFQNLKAKAADATASNIKSLVDWAYKQTPSWGRSKIDPIFKRYTLQELRRAVFDCDFETLFISADEQPLLRGDSCIKDITARLADTIFPEGMTLGAGDDAVTGLLNSAVLGMAGAESPLFKFRGVVPESAVMGWCAIRSVWIPDIERWLFEVHQSENVQIDTFPGVPDAVLRIALVWSFQGTDGKTYYEKERWTAATLPGESGTLERWRPLPALAGGRRPDFATTPDTTEVNTYGEIPVTIVPHLPDAKNIGVGFVGMVEVGKFKALLQRHQKRHYSDLFAANPVRVCKNHANPGEQFNYGLGATVHLQQSGRDEPVDLVNLDQPRIGTDYDETTEQLRAELWAAAGLKKPSVAEKTVVGNVASGSALEVLSEPEQKKIQSLRSGGYQAVLKHLAKVLRMGKALNLQGYAIVPDDVVVSATYPDFYEPTSQDLLLKIQVWQSAKLPPDYIAQQIATLFKIQDPELVEQIRLNWQEAQAAVLPGVLMDPPQDAPV